MSSVTIPAPSTPTPVAHRRITADITTLNSKEAKSLNLYYSPDETNINKGTALLFGPEGTIYQDLPILLEIEFPSNYPFSSPKVKFITGDGKTRFHPNLYVEGKVCLSILGTWQGPSWTSVMTLQSVLLSIMGLLDEEPLLHEPGYTTYKGKPMSKQYSEFVEHSSLRYIVNMLDKHSRGTLTGPITLFDDTITEFAPKIYKNTLARLEKFNTQPEQTWTGVAYGMSGTSTYKTLYQTCKSLVLKID